MQVIKRNGSKVDFESTKIYSAITNAAKEVFVLDDDLKRQLADLTTRIALDLTELDIDAVTISMVQSQVEQRLLAAGYIRIAERSRTLRI